MGVKERVKEFVSSKNISISAFCDAIGVSNSYVSAIRRSIQPDKIDRIALNYPDLNVEWLLTGKGSMLRSDAAPAAPAGTVVSLESLELMKAQWEIESLNKQLEALKKDYSEVVFKIAAERDRLSNEVAVLNERYNRSGTVLDADQKRSTG